MARGRRNREFEGRANGTADESASEAAAETDVEASAAPTAEQIERSANIGHNSKERASIITDAVRKIIGLKAERQTINEQINEERARVKVLGMKMIDFNVALRLYELEVEDRNASLDSIREACEALGMGETVDWVKIVETEDGKTGGAPGFTAEAGRQAWRENKRLHDNPYPTNSPSGELWKQGYLEEQASHARSMGNGTTDGATAH